MLWYTFVALGALIFLAWAILEITWFRLLMSANGSRPFVATTLRVGHVLFLESLLTLLMLPAYYKDNHGGAFFAALYGGRVLSLVAAVTMWRLHLMVNELVRAAHAKQIGDA